MQKSDQKLLEQAITDNVYRHNAAAVFIDKEWQVILCQRSAWKKFKPNLWHLPGWKIEDWEIPSVALQREIEEEMGVYCTVVFFTWVQYDHSDADWKVHRTSFFFCQGDWSIVLDFESQDIRRFKKNELKHTFLDINGDSELFYNKSTEAIEICLATHDHTSSLVYKV